MTAFSGVPSRHEEVSRGHSRLPAFPEERLAWLWDNSSIYSRPAGARPSPAGAHTATEYPEYPPSPPSFPRAGQQQKWKQENEAFCWHTPVGLL